MKRRTVIAGALLWVAGCKKDEVISVPDAFRVRFQTSKGSFVVETQRVWAPRGVDRFHELLRMNYFKEGRFFRVVPGFIAQFGVHKDYDVHKRWRKYFIVDDHASTDPAVARNLRGTLAFAQSGENTRATEIFINLKDSPELDEQAFTPFARVVEGMDVVEQLYAGYGDLGRVIDGGRLEEGANSYLARFPKLDYIKSTEILP